MQKTETLQQINKLFKKYNLGIVNQNPTQITGGLMHKMYLVHTEEKKFAVKELNSSIMKRPGVLENMINSERIAQALQSTIPVIIALQFNASPLLELDNTYYFVFEWFDGISIYPPNITEENCRDIGTILGNIHISKKSFYNISKNIDDSNLYDWNNYLSLGKEINSAWIEEFSQAIDDLTKWNISTNESLKILNNQLVLSHRDLDPKNVMWKNNKPYIIDWESAGYINPYKELLEVLNYWAVDEHGTLMREKFNELYKSYMQVTKNNNVDWDSVLNSGFSGMLGWLNYSFRRSLGIESSSLEEQLLGTQQVSETIKALYHYSNNLKTIKKWLEV